MAFNSFIFSSNPIFKMDCHSVSISITSTICYWNEKRGISIVIKIAQDA